MSKMLYKRILRATNLSKTANIEQNLMEYILSEGAHYTCAKNKDKDVWYNRFVGFFTDKSSPEWGFGYYDLKEKYIHYPLFADRVEHQIEDEEDYIQKPYLIMFYGSDNHSLFVRFATEVELLEFLVKDHKSMKQIESKYTMHFYNS